MSKLPVLNSTGCMLVLMFPLLLSAEDKVDEAPVPVAQPVSVPASVISLQESLVSAEIAANVEAIQVDVGDKVKKGDELARLDCREFIILEEQARADVNSLKANVMAVKAKIESARSDIRANQDTIRLLQVQTKVAQSNVVAANADFGRAKAQSNADQAQCHLANLELQRARDLHKRQVISQQALDTAVTTFRAAQAQCTAVQPELNSAQAKARSVQAGVEAAKVAVQVQQAKVQMAHSQFKVAEAGLPALQAQIAAANAKLKVEQLEVSRCTLKAPFNGEVVHRMVQLGQRIGIGEQAFRVISTEDKEVTAALSEGELAQLKKAREIHFQTPEQRIAVAYRAAVALVTGEAQTREVRFLFKEGNPLAIGTSGRVVWTLNHE